MESLNPGSGSSALASGSSGRSALASPIASSAITASAKDNTQIYNLQSYVDGLSKKYNNIDDKNLVLTKEELKNLKLLFESHKKIVNKYIGEPISPGTQV